MQVILFRHGPAGRRDASRWPDDADRPLTPKGERRTLEAALGLARLSGAVTHVVTSPLERAARSAAIVREALETDAPETLDALAPGRGYQRVLDRLRALPSDACVVLVGHEPDLGKLAGVLLFGAPAALPIRKAGACAIQFVAEVAPGAGRLKWFLPPRALRRVARRRSKV
jgi:phosphohistidine phosphatase